MSLPMQVKLFAPYRSEKCAQVGADYTTKVDARIITATNKDLTDCVKAGTFRHDLYYRVSVVPLAIPPCVNAGTIFRFLRNIS